jgi:hypothetical protein
MEKKMIESLTTQIISLWKAINTDDGGMGYETSIIGYYSTSIMAKSACADNPYTGVKEVKALKVLSPAKGPEAAEYYILAEEKPVQININFEEFTKKLRERAKAKLTEAEQRALGLIKD